MFRKLEIKSSKIMIFGFSHFACICYDLSWVSENFDRISPKTLANRLNTHPAVPRRDVLYVFVSCRTYSEHVSEQFAGPTNVASSLEIRNKTLGFHQKSWFFIIFCYISTYLSIFDAFLVHFGEISPKSRDGIIFALKKNKSSIIQMNFFLN